MMIHGYERDTGGKGRATSCAASVSDGHPSAGREPVAPAQVVAGLGGTDPLRHYPNPAPRHNALAHANDSPASGDQFHPGATCVRRAWSQTSLGPDLQAQPGFTLPGECPGCSGPESEVAGTRARPECGREKSDPGAGSHPTGPPDGERPLRHDNARL